MARPYNFWSAAVLPPLSQRSPHRSRLVKAAKLSVFYTPLFCAYALCLALGNGFNRAAKAASAPKESSPLPFYPPRNPKILIPREQHNPLAVATTVSSSTVGQRGSRCERNA